MPFNNTQAPIYPFNPQDATAKYLLGPMVWYMTVNAEPALDNDNIHVNKVKQFVFSDKVIPCGVINSIRNQTGRGVQTDFCEYQTSSL